MKLTWPQVHAWRLRRQHLDPPGNATALVLAKALAGVQAQVMSAAELAVAVRQEKSQAGEVRRALWEDRSLVKTWAMRGTLHLLPAREAGAYLTLMASLKPWEKGSWQKAFGATPKDLEALRDAALEALDGRSLTREQLTEKVGSSHLKEFLRSGWGTLLKPLAWWGALCHGPSEGNRVTFVRPDQWVKSWRMPELDEAASHVLRAYLGAYGPSTPELFDAWLFRGGIKKATLRGWFANEELAEVDVEGKAMQILAGDLDELAATKPSKKVVLLPAFDQYVLGPGTSSLPPKVRERVSRKGGWISPVVVRGGEVVGVWEGDGEVDLFDEVPAGPLKAAVERLRRVLG